MTQAYPLAWPEGWKRTPASNRKRANFGTTQRKYSEHGDHSWTTKNRITIAAAAKRVREELQRLGVSMDDSVISTNLKLNMSGLPRGDQGEPADPGVAVYWQKPGAPMRVMAIDAYDRCADNLAAIAATLEAMRSIERHGGAVILDRAFSGFAALPPPVSERDWWDVLECRRDASIDVIKQQHRRLAVQHHPDRGGDPQRMAEINRARDRALAERSP